MRMILPLMLAFSAAASGAERITVVAQRSMPTGSEQVALSIGRAEARMTRNANFLTTPLPAETSLGLFTSPLTPELRDERTILEAGLERIAASSGAARAIEKRAEGALAGARTDSPHETRWLLNGHGVESNSSFHGDLVSALTRAPDLGRWSPENAVRVRMKADGTVVVEPFGDMAKARARKGAAVSAECTARVGPGGSDAGYVCRVPGYGTAYLSTARRK